jgi:DNA topoisomerase I
VKAVAAELRNTPAVCRKSYINPCVFEAWKSGELHAAIGADVSTAPRKAERLALAFLQRKSNPPESPRTSNQRRELQLPGEAL